MFIKCFKGYTVYVILQTTNPTQDVYKALLRYNMFDYNLRPIYSISKANQISKSKLCLVPRIMHFWCSTFTI